MNSLSLDTIEVPHTGRTYSHERTVRLDAVDPTGRIRLDGLARLAQDVSSEDSFESGLDAELGLTATWLVSRLWMRIDIAPTHRESLELVTWCSGVGRSWAERRVRVRGSSGAVAEMAALWVLTDTASGRLRRLHPAFMSRYEEAAQGRRVKGRPLHDPPPAEAESTAWAVRRVDVDVLDHVNNAATWAAAEESGHPVLREPLVAEAEYRRPTFGGEVLERQVLSAERSCRTWMVGADGRVRTSLIVEALQ